MRILNIVCGVAVLINALHLAHAVHHFFTKSVPMGLNGTALWGGVGAGVIVAGLSFIGGCLLLRRVA